DARCAKGVGDRVHLALYGPGGDGCAHRLDRLGCDLSEVHQVPGLCLGAYLAARPDHEDVGRVTRLQRVRDERALQVFVLVAGHLDLDAGVLCLELGRDLLVDALERVGGRVVPPGDGDRVTVVVVAAAVAAARGEPERKGARGANRGDPCDAGSVHR